MKSHPYIPNGSHHNSIQPQSQGEVFMNDSPALQPMTNCLGIADPNSQLGLRIRPSYCFNSRSDADLDITDWCNVRWRHYFDILRCSQYQRNLHNELVVSHSQVVPISGALW